MKNKTISQQWLFGEAIKPNTANEFIEILDCLTFNFNMPSYSWNII